MPIDVKWLRNAPDQVEEWQRLRGLFVRPETPTLLGGGQQQQQQQQLLLLLQEVVDLDVRARRLLQEATHLRRSIKDIGQCLRPSAKTTAIDKANDNDNDNNDTKNKIKLLQDKKDLQVQLQRIQHEEKEVRLQLQDRLCALASPVDTQLLKDDKDNNLLNSSSFSSLSSSNQLITTSSQDWYYHCNTPPLASNWIPAIASHAYQVFGARYPSGGTAPTTKHVQAWQDKHEKDAVALTQAMWGSSSSSPSTSSVSSSSLLPPWLWWVQDSIPRKSRLGAKQLPLYSLLRGRQKSNSSAAAPDTDDTDNDNDFDDTEFPTLQLVALTPGTLWDARNIQLQLVQELVHTYQSWIVGVETTRVTTQVVPAPKLMPHEVSRMDILVETVKSTKRTSTTTQRMCLGSVSNFGDAASRACEWYFAGGGSIADSSKDLVHLVHANILSPETFSSLFWANTTTLENTAPKMTTLALPKCLEPFLIPNGSWERTVAAASATTKNEDSNSRLLGTMTLSSSTTQSTKNKTKTNKNKNISSTKWSKARNHTIKTDKNEDTTCKPKSTSRVTLLESAAATITTTTRTSAHRRSHGLQAEALSCPFDFVF